jgi:hypothetical protein
MTAKIDTSIFFNNELTSRRRLIYFRPSANMETEDLDAERAATFIYSTTKTNKLDDQKIIFYKTKFYVD